MFKQNGKKTQYTRWDWKVVKIKVIMLIFVFAGLLLIVKLIYEPYRLNDLYGTCKEAILLNESQFAEKNRPIFYVSKAEPAKIKNVFYQTFKHTSDDEIAIEYWLEWNESKAHFLSKLLRYGMDHKFEIEPLIIYIKDNEISHIAYTTGHYFRGTVLSNEIEFENNRPIVGIRKGDHAYIPNRKNDYKLDYELKVLDDTNKARIITEANSLAEELKRPFEKISKKQYDLSVNNIMDSPWCFGKIPNNNFLIFLFSLFRGDHTKRMFIDIQERGA